MLLEYLHRQKAAIDGELTSEATVRLFRKTAASLKLRESERCVRIYTELFSISCIHGYK